MEEIKLTELSSVCKVLDNLRKPINSSERQARIADKPVEKLFPYYGATGQVGWIDDYLTDDEYVLIGEDGAPFLDRFKPKAYLIKGKSWVNNHAHILKAIDGVSTNKFILHYLNSFNYHGYVNGTTRLKLTKGSLVTIPIPDININQQKLIVSKLEELFSKLDNGLQSLKTLQQQLKVYRQSVLKWAFEGRLTNANVKDGELPKGWRLVKSGDVIKTINNGYTPTKEFLFEGSGEVPFIKVYNLNFDGTLNYLKNPTFIPDAVHKKELKRSICYPGDVLINIVGPPLGKVSIVSNKYPEWNINQAIVMFRPNESVLSRYISYFLQNPVTINWLEGTSKATAGQWNVKVSTCREIPFPLCPVSEQEQIVQEIESRLSVCDKIEETITNGLKEAEALRQSILKQAFEGKLV